MIFVFIIDSQYWSSVSALFQQRAGYSNVLAMYLYSNVLAGRPLAINRILRVSRVVITKHHHVASNTLHNFCVRLIASIWLYWYTLIETSFLVHHKHEVPSDVHSFLQCTRATTWGAEIVDLWTYSQILRAQLCAYILDLNLCTYSHNLRTQIWARLCLTVSAPLVGHPAHPN